MDFSRINTYIILTPTSLNAALKRVGFLRSNFLMWSWDIYGTGPVVPFNILHYILMKTGTISFDAPTMLEKADQMWYCRLKAVGLTSTLVKQQNRKLSMLAYCLHTLVLVCLLKPVSCIASSRLPMCNWAWISIILKAVLIFLSGTILFALFRLALIFFLLSCTEGSLVAFVFLRQSQPSLWRSRKTFCATFL